MKWWELYDPAKRIPGYVPPLDDPATDRAGTAFMLYGVALVLFIGSFFAAFFFRMWTQALWTMAGSFVLLGVAMLLLPKEKSKPRP